MTTIPTTTPLGGTSPAGTSAAGSGFDFQSRFQDGLSYQQFIEKYANERDQTRWQAVYDAVVLTDDHRTILSSIVREVRLLCMAGTWCGDCVRQCPILQRFAEACPQLQLRFIDRDHDAALAAELRICGAPRVPQVVFLSEDGEPVHRFGDRTLSQYRTMAEKVSGASCATGIVVPGDESHRVVVTEWLNELERAALILRTSPKLRQRHGD